MMSKLMMKLTKKMLNKKMSWMNNKNKWKKIIFKNKMKMINNKRMIDIYFYINLYCIKFTTKVRRI